MKIKLIALFIMMGSLAAVADNDTYFFQSRLWFSVRCSNSRWILVSDNFNWQDFFRCGVVRRRQRLAVSRMGIGKNERGGILGLCELVVK